VAGKRTGAAGGPPQGILRGAGIFGGKFCFFGGGEAGGAGVAGNPDWPGGGGNRVSFGGEFTKGSRFLWSEIPLEYKGGGYIFESGKKPGAEVWPFPWGGGRTPAVLSPGGKKKISLKGFFFPQECRGPLNIPVENVGKGWDSSKKPLFFQVLFPYLGAGWGGGGGGGDNPRICFSPNHFVLGGKNWADWAGGEKKKKKKKKQKRLKGAWGPAAVGGIVFFVLSGRKAEGFEFFP